MALLNINKFKVHIELFMSYGHNEKLTCAVLSANPMMELTTTNPRRGQHLLL